MPASAPLNYFLHSDGPATHGTQMLGWVFTGISVAVCLVILVLLLIAIFRKQPEIMKDTSAEGVKWIAIGTGISCVILLGMVIYALVALDRIAQPPTPPALTLNVTGYDWWWKVDYHQDDPARHFTTANEIHIPVGVPVLIRLNSADVIHAFWVPVLAGKTQMIPGQTNQQWLQADVPGIYRGQCTQYCGLQHAHMAFEVVAENKADYQQWENSQRQEAPGNISPGQHVFMEHCAGCHTIRGSEAIGDHAPDLTHLASRRMLAAGLFTNTPAHLSAWITHAQGLKPGARMPDTTLSPADQDALLAYLSTLK